MGEYGEPWKTVENGDGFGSLDIVDAEGNSIAETNWISFDNADIRRTIACVNALDGVPDEAIPMVAKLVEAIRRVKRAEQDGPLDAIYDSTSDLLNLVDAMEVPRG